MRLILEADVDQAWDYLVQWRKNLRVHKRKAADRLLGYVVECRGMIRYREFRERGWQIGSGPTETQCNTTTLRLKGCGRRWDSASDEAIMALAALDASNTRNSWRASLVATAA